MLVNVDFFYFMFVVDYSDCLLLVDYYWILEKVRVICKLNIKLCCYKWLRREY